MSRRSPCINGNGEAKYPYDSEADAAEDARVAGRYGAPVRIYQCPVCKAFHIGRARTIPDPAR